MSQRPLSVLLVEDNAADARLIAERLDEASGGHTFHVARVNRLGHALARLESADPFDVVLLDLSLPDSHGLETLTAIRRIAPRVPVVVLTGREPRLGYHALRAGAEDYLSKGAFDGNLLVRSLRYAVERHLLKERLEAGRVAERRSRDRLILSLLGAEDLRSGPDGSRSLHDEHPELFAQLVQRYGVLVGALCDDTTDLTEAGDVEHFVDRLVVLQADAGDVLRIHDESMRDLDPSPIEGRARAAQVDAARDLLIEVLSRLANAYRSYSWELESAGLADDVGLSASDRTD